MSSKHRVTLEVTYYLDIPVAADDEDLAVVEIEKYLAKCDDYDIVNRSEDRQFRINKIVKQYDKDKAGSRKPR
jgi:hypothetical protein